MTARPARSAFILGVRDVYYNTRDLNRALEFYERVLDLRPVSKTRRFAALDVGGVRLGLHWTGGAAVPRVSRDAHGAHTGATLTLEVANIEEAAARLRAAGVTFLGPISRNAWGSLVSFEDPDGNVLKLMQPPPG